MPVEYERRVRFSYALLRCLDMRCKRPGCPCGQFGKKAKVLPFFYKHDMDLVRECERDGWPSSGNTNSLSWWQRYIRKVKNWRKRYEIGQIRDFKERED